MEPTNRITPPFTSGVDREDEISLVDIVAVLFRRRLVVLVVAGLGILAAAATLVLPALSRSAPIWEATVGGFLSDALETDPGPSLVALSRTEAFRAGAAVVAPADVPIVTYDSKARTLRLAARAGDAATAAALAERGMATLVAMYREIAARQAAFRLASLDSEFRTAVEVPGDHAVAFESFGAPVATRYDPLKEKTKSALLVVLSSLFMAFLTAFLADAIARMRSDPESAAKLRAAWRRERWTPPPDRG